MGSNLVGQLEFGGRVRGHRYLVYGHFKGRNFAFGFVDEKHYEKKPEKNARDEAGTR